jgi:hypothetical protein
VDSDQALERALRFRAYHFRVHLRQHAMRSNNNKLLRKKRSDGGAAHDSRRSLALSESDSRVPCFAQRTFYMAELGAERERMRSCFEELASVETAVLVECCEEEVFFWD